MGTRSCRRGDEIGEIASALCEFVVLYREIVILGILIVLAPPVGAGLLDRSNDGAVAIEVDGKFTVIDQGTSTRGAPRAVEIWALDPSQPNGLKDLVPLMEHGRTLCD